MIRSLMLLTAVLIFLPVPVAAQVGSLPGQLGTVAIDETRPTNDALVGTALRNDGAEPIRVHVDRDLSSRLLTEIKSGELFTVLDRDGEVARVATIDGIGFVRSADLAPDTPGNPPTGDPGTPAPPTATTPPPADPGTPPPPDSGATPPTATTPPPADPGTPPPTDSGATPPPTATSPPPADPVSPPPASPPSADTATTPPAGAPPAPPAASGPALTVTYDKPVVLRDGKSPDAGAVATMGSGATATLVAYEGAWCQVDFGGKRGFVRSFYVGLKDDLPPGTFPASGGASAPTGVAGSGEVAIGGAARAPGIPQEVGPVRVTHGEPVHLRTDKSVGAASPVSLPPGATVTLLAVEDNWCRIEYNGHEGYVRSHYLGYPSSRQISAPPTRRRDTAVPATPPASPPGTAANPPAAPPAAKPPVTIAKPPAPPAPPATANPPATGRTPPAPPVATQPPGDTPSKGDDATRTAQAEVYRLTNLERGKQNLKPLTLDEKLCEVAQKHAEDMERRNYFNHNNPEGESPFTRMSKAGISYWGAGENIAINYSPAGAVTAWMNSPGHRANILNGSFTQIGVGVSGRYYVQVFVSR